ncbi:hypothetical protein BJ165DRAFT_1364729 [Panaeolus papilionaceus]|nr:hypothetical protein BJ165DRAFT_1364729 [Panaeolus papilionaceus]
MCIPFIPNYLYLLLILIPRIRYALSRTLCLLRHVLHCSSGAPPFRHRHNVYCSSSSFAIICKFQVSSLQPQEHWDLLPFEPTCYIILYYIYTLYIY